MCFQTRDLVDAMRRDWTNHSGEGAPVVRVDGGMVASDWTMQFLADILDAPVDRPAVQETTALGAAYLAGLHIGLCASPAERMKSWKRERRFSPRMKPAERDRRFGGWREAICRTITVR